MKCIVFVVKKQQQNPPKISLVTPIDISGYPIVSTLKKLYIYSKALEKVNVIISIIRVFFFIDFILFFLFYFIENESNNIICIFTLGIIIISVFGFIYTLIYLFKEEGKIIMDNEVIASIINQNLELLD